MLSIRKVLKENGIKCNYDYNLGMIVNGYATGLFANSFNNQEQHLEQACRQYVIENGFRLEWLKNVLLDEDEVTETYVATNEYMRTPLDNVIEHRFVYNEKSRTKIVDKEDKKYWGEYTEWQHEDTQVIRFNVRKDTNLIHCWYAGNVISNYATDQLIAWLFANSVKIVRVSNGTR